jgi:hypothetical protein
MAKRRKKMQQRAERQRMRMERDQTIAEKEQSDAQGIRRAVRSGYFDGLSIKTINAIKFCLLFGGLAAYFLYSVLLLPVVLLYGLTFFATMQKQRSLNYGMRKDLRISLGKFDSLLALVAVFIVAAVLALSAVTNGTKNSIFAGKSEAQIYAIMVSQGMDTTQAQSMAKRMADSAMTLTAAQQFWINAGTMLTGQRELFESKNSGMGMTRMGGFNGGERPNFTIKNGQSGTGTRPNFVTRPPGGAGGFGGGQRPSGMGGNARFQGGTMSGMITDIFGIITKIFLTAVFIGGVIVCIKTNKHRKYETAAD